MYSHVKKYMCTTCSAVIVYGPDLDPLTLIFCACVCVFILAGLFTCYLCVGVIAFFCVCVLLFDLCVFLRVFVSIFSEFEADQRRLRQRREALRTARGALRPDQQ